MSAVSSFNTQEVHFWDKPQKQTAQTAKVIKFPQTYVAPPRLCVGLNSLDMLHGTNLRVNAYADQVDQEKFTAHIDTWADTTLYSAGIDTLVLKPADIDIQSGEFNNAGPASHRVDFERPFVTAPKVVCWLKAFDTGSGTSTRVKTYTSEVDEKGFTIHIETWADTTLHAACAGWIAYPEDKDCIASGTANTIEVNPWENPQPQLATHKDISFQGVSFWKKPTVFVALNWIDISTATNLRIRAYVDNVTTGGLTWHIDSWADTSMWSASISYIAFN